MNTTHIRQQQFKLVSFHQKYKKHRLFRILPFYPLKDRLHYRNHKWDMYPVDPVTIQEMYYQIFIKIFSFIIKI